VTVVDDNEAMVRSLNDERTTRRRRHGTARHGTATNDGKRREGDKGTTTYETAPRQGRPQIQLVWLVRSLVGAFLACLVGSFVRSFTSFVRSLRSFVRSLRSFVRSLRSFVRSLRSFVRSFVHFVPSFLRSFVPSFLDDANSDEI